MKTSTKKTEDKKIKKRTVGWHMSRQLEAILVDAEKDFATKRNIFPAFSSVEEAVRYLDSL